jgi:hypothetical protein
MNPNLEDINFYTYKHVKQMGFFLLCYKVIKYLESILLKLNILSLF